MGDRWAGGGPTTCRAQAGLLGSAAVGVPLWWAFSGTAGMGPRASLDSSPLPSPPSPQRKLCASTWTGSTWKRAGTVRYLQCGGCTSARAARPCSGPGAARVPGSTRRTSCQLAALPQQPCPAFALQSFSSGDVAYINLRLQDGTVPVVAYVDYSLSGRPVVQRYA